MPITPKDFFLSLLSMDSYNRGYAPGIKLEGNFLGSANLFQQSDIRATSPEVAAGFYAAAYNTQWGAVISYRGTDFDGGPDTADVLNGWAFAAGDFTAGQIDLSTQFLNTLASNSEALANITLTGHSLGGGLLH